MRRLLIAAAMVAAPGAAFAQFVPFGQPNPYAAQPAYTPPPSTNYDWRSGNMITTTPQPGGGANVNGFNANTGSTWNTQIQPNGNATGFDSRGNMWTYDRQTGNYMNSNGHGCLGNGPLRTCY